MLDAKPVNATFGNENFDDLAASTWGFDLATIYIDLNNEVSSVSKKGFKKYCSETLASDERYILSCTSPYWSSCKEQKKFSLANNQEIYVKKGSDSRCYNKEQGYGDGANCNGSAWTWTASKLFTCSDIGSDVWYK